MPSKRNSTAHDTREPTDSVSPTEQAPESRTAPTRRSPPPRPPRGAAVIPAPRKAELHRVALPPRPLPSHDQIARRAYELWLQSGCVAGRETENWAQAERELSTGCAGASAHQG